MLVSVSPLAAQSDKLGEIACTRLTLVDGEGGLPANQAPLKMTDFCSSTVGKKKLLWLA